MQAGDGFFAWHPVCWYGSPGHPVPFVLLGRSLRLRITLPDLAGCSADVPLVPPGRATGTQPVTVCTLTRSDGVGWFGLHRYHRHTLVKVGEEHRLAAFSRGSRI
jgi:hypothetical protein